MKSINEFYRVLKDICDSSIIPIIPEWQLNQSNVNPLELKINTFSHIRTFSDLNSSNLGKSTLDYNTDSLFIRNWNGKTEPEYETPILLVYEESTTINKIKSNPEGIYNLQFSVLDRHIEKHGSKGLDARSTIEVKRHCELLALRIIQEFAYVYGIDAYDKDIFWQGIRYFYINGNELQYLYAKYNHPNYVADMTPMELEDEKIHGGSLMDYIDTNSIVFDEFYDTSFKELHGVVFNIPVRIKLC